MYLCKQDFMYAFPFFLKKKNKQKNIFNKAFKRAFF